MDNFTASRTALATSLMRALHTRSDPNPLIDDPWGDKLVPASVQKMMRDSVLARLDAAARAEAIVAPQALVDASLRRSPAYANVITRTRYSEDALRAAVARGVTQYVLLGAGFDSFILRRPAFAAQLEIFEIDHPATQGLKRQRIADLGISLPGSVHFIAADFATETVAEVLSRSAFRGDLPSFFSWLGVTMYLTREANCATLRAIADCALPGSELALTYADEQMLESNSQGFQELQKRVTAMGEPFLSGFEPLRFAELLRECGLELIEDLTAENLAERYGRVGLSDQQHSRFSHMALARVLAHAGSHAKP